MHSSGVVILHYNSETRTVSILKKFVIPTPPGGSIGHALWIIYNELTKILALLDMKIFVREQAVPAHFIDYNRLMRVCGASDVALWNIKKEVFYDIPPSTAKKRIAGRGTARKDEVARGLVRYVGEQEYETNDVSDATAVGITFLIKGGYIDAIPDPLPD